MNAATIKRLGEIAEQVGKLEAELIELPTSELGSDSQMSLGCAVSDLSNVRGLINEVREAAQLESL